MKPKTTSKSKSSLHQLLDVGFRVRADFGTANMTLQEILDLQQRGLVELERAPDGYVDLYIDDQKIARGEVLAINNRYAVRITEIVDAPLERPQFMGAIPMPGQSGEVHAPSFADLLKDAEAEEREAAEDVSRVHESSIADAYEFPRVDELDGSREGRRDEPSSGPVDRNSETYSPRRSVPNPRQSPEA